MAFLKSFSKRKPPIVLLGASEKDLRVTRSLQNGKLVTERTNLELVRRIKGQRK